MVTELKTRERVETRQIRLEQLGEMIGVPLKVRPWWGSVRRYSSEAIYEFTVTESGIEGEKEIGRKRRLTWECPGGHTGSQKKNPEVQNGVIILREGACRCRHPYRTRHGYNHIHAQRIEVKSVARQAMLIVIRLSSNPAQFLLGMDGGSPYVVQVPLRMQTCDAALDWLMPSIVRKAMEDGLDVKRQGDWYFIPRDKPPIPNPNYRENVYGSTLGLRTNTVYRGAALVFNGAQTRHRGGIVVYQSIAGVNGPAPIVKGKVTAPDHEPLHLSGWHIGARNRSHPWRNASHSRLRFDD